MKVILDQTLINRDSQELVHLQAKFDMDTIPSVGTNIQIRKNSGYIELNFLVAYRVWDRTCYCIQNLEVPSIGESFEYLVQKHLNMGYEIVGRS